MQGLISPKKCINTEIFELNDIRSSFELRIDTSILKAKIKSLPWQEDSIKPLTQQPNLADSTTID